MTSYGRAEGFTPANTFHRSEVSSPEETAQGWQQLPGALSVGPSLMTAFHPQLTGQRLPGPPILPLPSRKGSRTGGRKAEHIPGAGPGGCRQSSYTQIWSRTAAELRQAEDTAGVMSMHALRPCLS